jgi:hypothetical protein
MCIFSLGRLALLYMWLAAVAGCVLFVLYGAGRATVMCALGERPCADPLHNARLLIIDVATANATAREVCRALPVN